MLQLERELFTITLVCFNTKGHVLAEEVGFEPTVPCGTSHFKCGAINQTLPLFRIFGPCGEIRTPGPLVPNQMRYQAALHTDYWLAQKVTILPPLSYQDSALPLSYAPVCMLLAVYRQVFNASPIHAGATRLYLQGILVDWMGLEPMMITRLKVGSVRRYGNQSLIF